ncbi:hypothetical protein BsWGS_05918 [Bradybaena similaris]
MGKQMERTTFYDVVITVKQRTFKCHRFQLSACSKFFQAMFSSGMNEDLAKTVEIKGIEPDIFSLVIECIYKARYVINAENVTSLWHAANQLQIDFLTESCEIFLAENLSKYNCVEIYRNAKLLDPNLILKLSWELIVKEFEYLRKTETILNLDYEDMMKLLADDALVVPSEDVLIDVIMRWVNFILEPITVNNEQNRMTAETPTAHLTTDKELTLPVASEEIQSKEVNTKENVENMQEKNITALKEQDVCENEHKKKETNFREQFLPSLLSAAKICLVSSTCLQSLTESKLIFENQKALAVVRTGLRYHLQPGRRNDYCPPSAIHRSSSEFKNVVMCIFVQQAPFGQVVQKVKVQMSCRTMDGIWFRLAAPVNYLAQCRAVSYGNDVFALPTNGYQYAFKYDSRTNTWRQLASVMNVPRQNTSVVVLDHYIYAIGGDTCQVIERFSAEAEQSKPGSAKWENIGELTHAVTNTVVTTLGNNIFVFGNTSDNSASVTIQRFDTQTMTSYISLQEMLGASKNMVAFKYQDNNFLLQETGALWKMAASDKCDFSLKLLGVVWDFPLELSAATICNNELLVFVKSIDPKVPCEWDTVICPEFKHVKIIHREVNCLLNIVIPKALLKVKEA